MNDNVDNNGNNDIIMIRASVTILIIRASLVIVVISRKEERKAKNKRIELDNSSCTRKIVLPCDLLIF